MHTIASIIATIGGLGRVTTSSFRDELQARNITLFDLLRDDPAQTIAFFKRIYLELTGATHISAITVENISWFLKIVTLYASPTAKALQQILTDTLIMVRTKPSTPSNVLK